MSAERSELASRLRSSDAEVVLGATDSLKALAPTAIIQSLRPTGLLEDVLDAMMTCLGRFTKHEDINARIASTVGVYASANKEYAAAVFSSGIVTSLLFALKSFIRSEEFVYSSLRVLLAVCRAERKASVIVRLQGGLLRVIEVLDQKRFVESQKIVRLCFEFLDLMAKRSLANTAVVAKLRGIALIIPAARMHISNGRVFQSSTNLLEKMCTSPTVLIKLVDNDIVEWIFTALSHYQYAFKTMSVLLRMLRNLARSSIGAKAITEAGGFDVVLSIIEPHLSKSVIVRTAASVLWNLQRHQFVDSALHDDVYRLHCNNASLIYTKSDSTNADDGDDDDDDDSDNDEEPESDVEDDQNSSRLDEEVDAASTDANLVVRDGFELGQFTPELWAEDDADATSFWERNEGEIRNATVRSIREWADVSTPPMVASQRNGDANKDVPPAGVERYYQAPQGLVLQMMHSCNDRLENPESFKGIAVYDRADLDGSFFHVPDVNSSPRTVWRATTLASSNDVDSASASPSTAIAAERSEADVNPVSEFVSDLLNAIDFEGPKPPTPVPENVDRQSKLVDVAPENVVESEIPPLMFESRFECGNLHRVIQAGDTEYELILSSDLGTSGHTQWFYFSVENMLADVDYKFSVINLEKPESAFNRGMRPVMFSRKSYADTGVSWFRVPDAHDIAYFPNYHRRAHFNQARRGGKDAEHDAERQYHHTLTFTMSFPHANDSVFLAHFYPFSYSFLRHCLSSLQTLPGVGARLRRQVLCYSRAGNAVDLLTITNLDSARDEIASRPVAVLSARVHPGETNSSWVMKGVIDFLLSSHDDAVRLRNNVVFKVVPMLNPDGVVEGHYRCSLAANDQNRQWLRPSKISSPVVFHFKRFVKAMARTRHLLLFCDFHGHSIIHNFCMYGNDEVECPPSLRPKPLSDVERSTSPPPLWLATVGPDFKGKERVFAALLARRCSRFFSHEQCSFSVQKSKSGTARVVMWRELRLHNCFTLEASFNGGSFGPMENVHYNTQHYECLGRDFSRTIGDLISPQQTEVQAAAQEVSSYLNSDAIKTRRRSLRRRTGDKAVKKQRSNARKRKPIVFVKKS